MSDKLEILKILASKQSQLGSKITAQMLILNDRKSYSYHDLANDTGYSLDTIQQMCAGIYPTVADYRKVSQYLQQLQQQVKECDE